MNSSLHLFDIEIMCTTDKGLYMLGVQYAIHLDMNLKVYPYLYLIFFLVCCDKVLPFNKKRNIGNDTSQVLFQNAYSMLQRQWCVEKSLLLLAQLEIKEIFILILNNSKPNKGSLISLEVVCTVNTLFQIEVFCILNQLRWKNSSINWKCITFFEVHSI